MQSTASRSVIVVTVVVSIILTVLVAGTVSKPEYYSYLEDADFIGVAADPHSVHRRWKREGGDSGGWKLPGSGWLKKLKKLYSGYEGLPPNLKDAISEGDFSKVTRKDIEDTNVTLLEYIPSKVFEKVDVPVLTAFMDKFIQNGRSNALGRLVESASSKLSPEFLLDKLKNEGNNMNVSTDILLYSAVSKLGDKGKITEDIVHTLIKEDLLKSVPQEQLMKVKDVGAANTLLQNLGLKHEAEAVKDIDHNSLMIKLVETGIGPAQSWSRDSLKYLEVMPGAFLKGLKPELVAQSTNQIAKSDLTPLQAKAVTDVYFEKHGTIPVNQEGIANSNLLEGFTSQLGKLAAFIPPGLTKNPNILKTIVDSCDKMNLPAPIKSVAAFFVDKLKGNKKISDLSFIDFQSIPASVLKNSPPEIVSRAISERSLDDDMLETIGKSAALDEQGTTQNSFFQGLIQQLSAYAVQAFSHGSHIDFSKLPGAFFGALGIKGVNNIKGNDVDIAANGLKDNPDALDDVQKALLIKKMKDSGDDVDLPPELIALMPRKKNERVDPDVLDGLPSDSELRLAFGDEHNSRPIRAAQLEENPHLIGTLTPKQVETIDLEEIPAVLALVRSSRDGPPTPTIKALHARFVEYIRLKTDDYESDDKKLLKHVTAAEVHKLPATVLAYFIDHRQTGKLPASVKKEILIALGELSPKDHATVPGKTRNEIILQGLDALDEILGKEEKYDVPELAAVGNAVVDLPPNRVARLTPVALELALQSIQGTAENPERLQHRACLSPEQRKAWRDQIINNYGSPETWSSSTISALCCSLELLNEDDLKKLDKHGIATCNCVSDLAPPSHLAELKNSLDRNCQFEMGEEHQLEGKKAFDRVKAEKSLDIEDIESQIIVGRKRRDADKTLNCYALRLTGKLDGYEAKALETLDPKEMSDCLYELGVSKLDHEKAKVLWKKLVQAYAGSVERIPAESLRLANHVLSGINEGDVSKLNFSDPDVVAYFGRPLGMSKNILKKMATHLIENKKYPLGRFQSPDLMVARNILCGFEHDRLAEIDPNAFREALPILSTIEPTCEQVRLASLANIATSPNVFGPTSTWKAADVRAMGTLLKGFTTEIKNIPSEAFLGLTSTTASSLTDSLKHVTAEQVKFIPTFAAQSMSKSQIEEMNEEAQDALQSVQRGPLVSDNAFQSQGQWTIVIFATITAIANIL